MTFQFRVTSPDDSPAVAAFLQRIFDIDPSAPLIAPQHLQWKCWEDRSDWTGSRGYVLTSEGEIVAHGTVVPLSYVGDHVRLRMVHLIDWAADPRAIGSGVTLLRHIAQLVDAVVAVGGSRMSQKVLPALGFKQCGHVTTFVRPLRPLLRLTNEKLGIRLLARIARSLLWSFQAPTVRTQGWTTMRIAPDQVTSDASWLPQSGLGIARFARTAEMFHYFLACPVMMMELYVVAQEGVRRGYFLLARVDAQTRIVDLGIDSEKHEDWCALIQLAVAQAKQDRGTAEVVAFGSDDVTRQALYDCGFRSRENLVLRILGGRGIDVCARPVRFQMIDKDAAYLYNNDSVYWA